MDLSVLPDDQLLQLIEAVTKEVARRAIAIKVATRQYWQEAADKIDNDRQSPIDNDDQSPIGDDCIKATVVSLLKSLDFFKACKYDSFQLSIWEKMGMLDYISKKVSRLMAGSLPTIILEILGNSKLQLRLQV